MARTAKKRKKKEAVIEEDDFELSEFIKPDTLRAVCGIFLVAIAVYLGLAAFSFGGIVGDTLFEWLSTLMGVGYVLLPISVLISAVVLFRPFERRVALQLTGSAVFFLAALGLVQIVLPGGGGLVGAAIANPMIAAVDTAATVLFLTAFIIASLFIALDIHPVTLFERIKALTHRGAEDDLDISDVSDDDEAYDDEPEQEEEEEESEEEGEEPEEKPAAPVTKPFWKRSEDTPPQEEITIMRAPHGNYIPPPVSLLGKNKGKPEVGDVKANANIIKRTLLNFGIRVEMDEVSIGPTVTRYAMKPAEGVRLGKIVALQSNLELALAASPVRLETPIPGKSLVGIEVPNASRATLGLSPLMSDSIFTNSAWPLALALGRSITGSPHFADLSRMPHLLIAGATGAGKSVTIHNLVVSLLYRRGPEEMRFVMIDPKRVELTGYNSLPHLLTPVITDAKKAILSLKWLAKEMDRRYDILEAEKVRDIASYHANVYKPALEKAERLNKTQGDDDDEEAQLPEPLPYIVVIIDELADIMQTYPRELEAGIVRLAQMSRAVGIHLVLSTQRPSVKVITGLIKANIPARIALQVASQIDSRTILDMGGAEKLLGAGDMLFLSGEMAKPKRIQAPYISEDEVKKVVKHIAKQYENTLPDEIDFTNDGPGSDAIFSASLEDDDEDDELYGEAKRIVQEAGKASTSYLQRKLRVGYARAARLMDLLEERGVIGPADGSRPREVIGAGAEGYEEEEYDEEEALEEK